MPENHEVFLGQKESVARYNLDAKETVWSTKVIGTPTLISTFKGYLIIQGLNKWGTKYIVHCLNASSGNLLWYSEEFKNIIVPHFIADDFFFLDQKWQICKVSLPKGQVYFREKFAGAFRKYAFHLAVSGVDIYLISKSETLQVDKSNGSLLGWLNLGQPSYLDFSTVSSSDGFKSSFLKADLTTSPSLFFSA